jgi:hypothetical protein
LSTPKKERFEYPLGRAWVCASAIMSGISIAFAIAILKDDVKALFLYFTFTSLFTLIVLALKYHFYSKKWEQISEEVSSASDEVSDKRWKLGFVLLVLLTLGILFTPLILSYILDPLWLIISISGFVPGVSIPEIILFLYSRSKKD